MRRWRMCLSLSPAGICETETMAKHKYWPIWQLTLSRLREFLRQPAAIFWVYGFPIIMMLSLGAAFRDNQTEEFRVDLVESTGGQTSEVGSQKSENVAGTSFQH